MLRRVALAAAARWAGSAAAAGQGATSLRRAGQQSQGFSKAAARRMAEKNGKEGSGEGGGWFTVRLPRASCR